MNLKELRKQYDKGGLTEETLPVDPFDLFKAWLQDAIEAGILEPNAMALSTVDAQGSPDVRIVLLKDIVDRGIRFFTNYESEKGRQLTNQPQASVAFWWDKLERQVRIKGTVERIPEEDSLAYFQSRPRESQIGAWASAQSTQVSGRSELEESFEAMRNRFSDKEIPLPPFWGGFQITITSIEFWQGRPNRLHDRIRYTFQSAPNNWSFKRLAP